MRAFWTPVIEFIKPCSQVRHKIGNGNICLCFLILSHLLHFFFSLKLLAIQSMALFLENHVLCHSTWPYILRPMCSISFLPCVNAHPRAPASHPSPISHSIYYPTYLSFWHHSQYIRLKGKLVHSKFFLGKNLCESGSIPFSG